MILTGPEIKAYVERGFFEIDPWEPKNINPASLDLRLGSKFAVYNNWVLYPPNNNWSAVNGRLASNERGVIDTKKPEDFDVTFYNIYDEGVILQPGILYLMHTVERVHVRTGAVPILDGKSSIGRLGIVIHLTAGYGDIGFNGQYTLEVSVLHRVRVYAGMRFCQMRFHRIVGDELDYGVRGQYTGKDAEGPVASKVYSQFCVKGKK